MSIGLVFPGQGAQYVKMGKSLYDTFPQARSIFDCANDVLGYDLRSICFDGPEAVLVQTVHCQPAIFVHSYSVYQILLEGKCLQTIQGVLGLSLGEITALTVAKVVDFETGLKLVAKRAQWMQAACEATHGSMVSLIGGPVELAEELCKQHDIDLANYNCPGQVVISGPTDRVEAAIQDAKQMPFKKVIPLKVAGAYHSRLMAPASQQLKAYLQGIAFARPCIPFFSNTTGTQLEEPEAIKEKLAAQVVSPVRWDKCFQNAAEGGIQAFLECGPGSVLTSLARRIYSAAACRSLDAAEELQHYLHS